MSPAGGADAAGLAAAYALGALDDDERTAVEQQMRTDPDLAAEVADFRRTLGDWGSSVSLTPPPAMRDAVMAALDDVEQLPRLARTVSVDHGERLDRRPDADPDAPDAEPERLAPVTMLPRQSRRRPVVALLASAAAAVVVVAAGLTGWQVLRGDDADGRDVAGAVERLESAPDSVVVPVTDGTDGPWSKTWLVYSGDEGQAVVASSASIPAPASGVYVVWRMEPSGPESAASFHSGTGAVLDGSLDDVETVAVTIEPDADVDAPSTDPVAVYEL